MTASLSPDEAERFISDRYGNRAGRLSALGAGEWSQAYALTLDGREAVVRFGAYGDDFAKDEAMSHFSSSQLPIPKVLALGAAPQGFFIVSERAHGSLLDDLDEAAMRIALPNFLKTLDAIGSLDVSSGRGYGLWRPDATAPHASWCEALLDVDNENDRIAGWRATMATSQTAVMAFEVAYAQLQELAPTLPGERLLIHNDLLHFNVLVQGPDVTGVLDWGNAQYGDALYDAAWLLYFWPWYPAWAGIDIRAELDRHWQTRGFHPADLETRLRCYQLHIGLDAMSYTAFTGRFGDLERNAEQVLALARRAR